ncbi:MAG: chitinase [Candidatus Eremiobacteraeota bacterium]|nr:chitinase [Candidatus Eremiobacteraeota bacterium]
MEIRWHHMSVALAVFLGTNTAAVNAAVSPLRVAFPRHPALRSAAPAPERDIFYYQTQYYNAQYQSLAPIWRHRDPTTHLPYVTDVMVAAFHLGYNTGGTPYIHLNDNVPSDPMFRVMWHETAKLQRLGITVRMMLGGAAQGSYGDLFSNWSTFYPILRHTLKRYDLNGIDLDVEETVSLADIERLISALNRDFGKSFIITLSPVCSALWGGPNLSGFSYIDLYNGPEGPDIAWFNAQFYSGFGSLQNTTDYDHVLAGGVFPADKVVAGVIDNPNDGSGFVAISTLVTTLHALTREHHNFGGVAGWEYFNALPGGQANPNEFARIMAQAMR